MPKQTPYVEDTDPREKSPHLLPPIPRWSNIVVGVAIGLGFLGLLGAPLKLWSGEGWEILSSKTSTLIGATVLLVLGIVLGRGRLAASIPPPITGALLLGALFCSDWLTRGYSFFQGPSIRGEIFLFGAITWWVLKRSAVGAVRLVAIGAPLLLVWAFLSVAAGRMIFSDDHPVFLFRLISLKENFPFIPFYNPLWNGGIDARDFFATGALNVFLPFFPIIRLFDVTSVYNYIVIGIVFILGPAATYLAARIERGHPAPPSPAPAIAAILHLTVSLLWFRWCFKYGTMGFVTAASLVPLNLVLASVVVSRDRSISPRMLLLAVLTLSLMVCWSLAGVVFLPCLLVAIIGVRRLWRKPKVLPLAALLLAINLPWIALFWSVSNVGRFVHAEKNTTIAAPTAEASPANAPAPQPRTFRSKAKGASLTESVKTARESAISMNPLILAFALPGLFLLGAPARLLFGLTAVWLTALGVVGAPLKPQLELDRMLLVLGLIGTIPASLAVTAVFERGAGPGRGIIPRALGALAGGFLLTGPFVVSGIVHNRSPEQFYFADPSVAEMSDAIKKFGGAGRVLYSGFVLHELSNGHLAPLVYLSGHPLIASSYAHDKWRYEQVFPEHFLREKDSGIQRYLDLYNVTAVFAHERVWRDYFRARPNEFSEVWRGGRFALFTRLHAQSNYFLEGHGAIEQQRSNGVVFRLTTPDAVLKFNHFPFVRVAGCSVSPAPVEGGLTFIKVSGCPTATDLTLESVDPITRLVHHE